MLHCINSLVASVNNGTCDNAGGLMCILPYTLISIPFTTLSLKIDPNKSHFLVFLKSKQTADRSQQTVGKSQQTAYEN